MVIARHDMSPIYAYLINILLEFNFVRKPLTFESKTDLNP
jgi:hypothetical protein